MEGIDSRTDYAEFRKDSEVLASLDKSREGK